MHLNVRMLPPTVAAQQTLTANGRRYSATPGQVLDVPDQDGQVLSANAWTIVAPVGATSARASGTPQSTQPYLLAPAFHFMDTTLGYLIVWDGATWRDPNTGNAV